MIYIRYHLFSDFHNDDMKSPSRNSSDSRLLKSPLRPNLRKDGNKILDEGKNLIPANKTKLPLQLQRWRKPQGNGLKNIVLYLTSMLSL